eukprot:PLAT7917.1.p1 GENE.PLAT7917.1~~PLAT7917.1.p1  ORF type:complete len:477 (+),score=226.70 PLAT7917.1:128-1432(+)
MAALTPQLAQLAESTPAAVIAEVAEVVEELGVVKTALVEGEAVRGKLKAGLRAARVEMGEAKLDASRSQSVLSSMVVCVDTVCGSLIGVEDAQSLAPLISEVVRSSQALMNVQGASVFLYDPVTSELWSPSDSWVLKGAGRSDVKELRIPSNKGIAGASFTDKETIVIQDTSQDARFVSMEDKTGTRTRNLVAVPIINARGDAIGVLEVLNKRGKGPFAPSDITLLQSFATIVALLVEHANKTMELREAVAHNERSTHLFRIACSLADNRNHLDNLLRTLGDELKLLFGAQRSAIFFTDWERDLLWSRVLTGIVKKSTAGKRTIEIPIDAGFVGAVATSGVSLNVADAYSDPRFDSSHDKKTGFYTEAVLAVPVMSPSGEVMAVLEIINRMIDSETIAPWREEDERQLEIVAGLTSSALWCALGSEPVIMGDAA